MIVDAIIVASIGFFAWRGFRRGLLAWGVRLAGFVVATAAAVYGYRVIGAPLQSMGMSEGLANIVGAVAIFVGVVAASWFVSRALTRLLDWTKWGLLNKAGGAAFAGAWALSAVTVVLLGVSVSPASGARDAVERSALARGIIHEAPRFATTIAHTNLRRFIETFVSPSDDRLLVAATNDFRDLEQAARALFDRVTNERRARGLAALRWDPGLATAARNHAAEMYLRGYFSHDTPEGLTPGDRLKRAHVAYSITSENIALAGSVDDVHAGFMRSATHRAHILGARFTRIGIGVMYGRQGLMVAEEFAR